MKKILKMFLYLIIWLIISALITIGAMVLGLSWESGAKLSTGVFVVWLILIILRKYITQYRAKKRVENLIQEDTSGHSKGKKLFFLDFLQPSAPPDSLTRKFKALLKLLKDSSLRKQGDPVYVLPWFLLIGSSGSGKTSALEFAQLPSPILEDDMEGDDGCAFRLYNQGIIVDTPGDYVSGLDHSGTGNWNRLLQLIEKFRRKEPLNGIIITVAADKLLSENDTELYEEGRKHRGRIDGLITKLKIKVPVYLLITKTDQIEGFCQWCDTLAKVKLLEPMGFTKGDENGKVSKFILKAIDAIIERIKDLILISTHQKQINHNLLRLPSNMSQLSNGLIAYTNGIFEFNPYQETPFLRGVYFSGINEQQTETQKDKQGLFLQKFFTDIVPSDRLMLSTLAGIDRVTAITRRFLLGGWGVAIITFFAILIWAYTANLSFIKEIKQQYAGRFVQQSHSDIQRNLESVFRLREMINIVDNKVGSMLWIPWLGFDPAFLNKLKAIYLDRFQDDLLFPVDQRIDTIMRKNGIVRMANTMPPSGLKTGYKLQISSLKTLKQVHRFIAGLKEKKYNAYFTGPYKNRWYIVWGGPFETQDQAMRQKIRLNKDGYFGIIIRKYNKESTQISTEKNLKDVSGFNEESQESPAPYQIALFVKALSHRITFLEKYLAGADIYELELMAPPFAADSPFFTTDITPEFIDKFNFLYIHYLADMKDRDKLTYNLERLRAFHKKLINLLLNDPASIIALINEKIKTQDFARLSSYWTGSGGLKNEIQIPGAFSIAGRKYIETYLESLSAIIVDLDNLERQKDAFWNVYNEAYLNAWKKFATDFFKGKDALRSREEYIAMIDVSASERNPFFTLLDVMYEQLQPFSQEAELPENEWLKLINYYNEMKLFDPNAPDTTKRDNKIKAMAIGAVKKLGVVGKLVAKVGKKSMKTQKKLAGPPTDKELKERLQMAGTAMGDYKKALIDIAFNMNSRDVSLSAMKDFFSNPNAKGEGAGPASVAYQSIHQLERLLGKRRNTNDAFWAVYTGAMDVIYDYLLQEASCQVQQKWEDNFLVHIDGVPEYKRQGLMFGESGKLWGFLNDEIGAFISRAYGKGYIPTKVNGNKMSFMPEFVNFISRGRDMVQIRPDKYTVHISTMPTNANKSALVQPSVTMLKLECADSPQELINYNFATSATFEFTEKCGDVLLTIEIGNLKLEKTFTGPKAFPLFLREFRDGSYRYTPDYFPENKTALLKMGVEYIEVQYEFSNHEPVISLLDISPPDLTVPQHIIACWER